MGFGDLKAASGLKVLNDFLSDRSYIEGSTAVEWTVLQVHLRANRVFVLSAAKLVPVGYGIKKLQISCVVEDDKVGTDILEEKITAFEDHVQSMDVAAFNKI
uniref:Eukaryotic translation elongation factor 1 beta 2 n=1 Tax=Fundulus heteroclitus TaxID=8078 RepID=A0A3Q2QR80_FUNHE